MAKSKKAALATANVELHMLTSESNFSYMSSSIRSYCVEINNGGDSYSLELLDHKPEREVPEELFAKSLAHPVATKCL